MQKKSQGVPSSMADPYERFAFTCGLASILPYGAFWLMLQLDPYESSYRLAHGAMGVLFSFGIILFAPVVIGLLISLILFWGARSNPTLLAMRVIGLFANTVLLLALLLAIVGNI